MENEYIISEDSRMGLLFWALTNRYIFKDRFKLRFCNKDRPLQNIYLEDINNWENKNYLLTENLLGDKHITAGIDKLPKVTEQIETGSKVLLAVDALGLRGTRPAMLEAVRKDMEDRGIRSTQLWYNCGAEFLLSFLELKGWCLQCYPKPRADTRGKVYWNVLDAIQKELATKESSIEKLEIWDEWIGLPESRIYGVTAEDALEALLHQVTKNSYLWYRKDSISDCWAYDCCYEELLRGGKKPNIHGCISEKWQYIYDHSTIKTKIENAMKHLDIPIPQRPVNKISVNAPYRIKEVRYHGTNAETTDEVTWSQDGPNYLIIFHANNASTREFYIIASDKPIKKIYAIKVNKPKEFMVSIEGDDGNSYSLESIFEKFPKEQWQKITFAGDNKALRLSPCVYVCSDATANQQPPEQSPSTTQPQEPQPPQSSATVPGGQAEIPPQQFQHPSEAQTKAMARTLADMLKNPSQTYQSETNYIFSVIQVEKAKSNSYTVKLFLGSKDDDIANFESLEELHLDTVLEVEGIEEHCTPILLVRYPDAWIRIPRKIEGAYYASKFKYPVRVVPAPPDQIPPDPDEDQ